MIRYRQFFGVDPSTAAQLFRDLRSKFPSFNYKDGLMTLNWLYLNNKKSVLSGRWKCCKETIGITLKRYAKMIQSLKKKKIKFLFTHGERHISSIDCCNFITNESTKTQVVNGLTTKVTPAAWYVFCFLA
jgi:hypothetical protein